MNPKVQAQSVTGEFLPAGSAALRRRAHHMWLRDYPASCRSDPTHLLVLAGSTALHKFCCRDGVCCSALGRITNITPSACTRMSIIVHSQHDPTSQGDLDGLGPQAAHAGVLAAAVAIAADLARHRILDLLLCGPDAAPPARSSSRVGVPGSGGGAAGLGDGSERGGQGCGGPAGGEGGSGGSPRKTESWQRSVNDIRRRRPECRVRQDGCPVSWKGREWSVCSSSLSIEAPWNALQGVSKSLRWRVAAGLNVQQHGLALNGMRQAWHRMHLALARILQSAYLVADQCTFAAWALAAV